MPERSKPRTHDQVRHDFNAALHTARITLRALRPKVTSQDDLDLLDGAADAVNKMAATFQALTGPAAGEQ